MKTAIALFFLCLTNYSFSQTNKQPKDSIKYYNKQLIKLRKDAFDSIRLSDQYISLQTNLVRLLKKSKNYDGVIFSGEMLHSDYSKFNKSINQNGFSSLNSISFRVGLGLSYKKYRRIFDFYFGTLGLANKSKKGDESIKSSLSNLLQFNFGYVVLNARLINIYPYAGLSIRTSTLRYSKPNQINTSFTNITNIVVNDQSIVASSSGIGYQLGLNFDFFILNSKEKQNGLIFFAKIASDNSIGKETYKISGTKYNPSIKHGDWLIGFGIKLIGPQ